MSESLILFGAGTTGRVIVRRLRAEGQTLPVCFADNDPDKRGTMMEGVPVLSPEDAKDKYPDAAWTASVVHPPLRAEITSQMEQMQVKSIPVWGLLPRSHENPPMEVWPTILRLAADKETEEELRYQLAFRRNPDYEAESTCSDINEIYFPDFIKHRDDEHFVDCGAADGDTVKVFRKRWPKYRWISAFEPDPENFKKLCKYHCDIYDNGPGGYCRMSSVDRAIGACWKKNASFVSTGDYSARLGDGSGTVECWPLDNMMSEDGSGGMPTYIKADIEGSELEMLWGARHILKEHSPVLAICAYHKPEDLWEIPLLLHVLQPRYKLFLRRYAKGTFELVWYGVPPGRVKA